MSLSYEAIVDFSPLTANVSVTAFRQFEP